MLFFTDPIRTSDPGSTLSVLPRGAAIVFRAFGHASAVSTGAILAKAARRRGVIFMVGADAALATRLRADGVHLPERLAGRVGAIRVLRQRFLVTAAAHSLPAALRVARGGADAIVFSPIFASNSPSAGRAFGARALAAVVRAVRRPIYALGGVNLATVRRLRHTGVVGFGAIEAFLPEKHDAVARADPGAVRRGNRLELKGGFQPHAR